MVATIPEDEIEQSKAPLIEHLIELRKRLIYCVIALSVAFAFSYGFAGDIYNFLLIPYKLAVGSEPIKLIYTAPHEYFLTKLRVSFLAGMMLSSPVIAAQIYMFVAPGLYRNERQAILPYIIATPVLFVLGGALVFFVVMPLAMRFFLSMQQTGDAQVHIELESRVSEYFYFIMTFIRAFGLCFQLPVVLTLLARAGLVTSEWLIEQWRYAIVLAFVAAMFLTPGDFFSQLTLALPTIGLYGLSILSVRLVERQRARRENRE